MSSHWQHTSCTSINKRIQGFKRISKQATNCTSHNDSSALGDITALGCRTQKNGESIQCLGKHFRNLGRRLERAGYAVGENILTLHLVRAVLHEAYSKTSSFRRFQEDIVHQHLILSELSFETPSPTWSILSWTMMTFSRMAQLSGLD